MAVCPPDPGTPSPDATDIQGNLVGFNKDHQRLVFVGFADAASGKAFLQALVPDVATALGHQDGNGRPGAERGHEHFGFKDGIPQPGIDGLTTPSKTGTDTIAAGEFLIGIPTRTAT